jgi:hypothetical protein
MDLLYFVFRGEIVNTLCNERALKWLRHGYDLRIASPPAAGSQLWVLI